MTCLRQLPHWSFLTHNKSRSNHLFLAPESCSSTPRHYPRLPMAILCLYLLCFCTNAQLSRLPQVPACSRGWSCFPSKQHSSASPSFPRYHFAWTSWRYRTKPQILRWCSFLSPAKYGKNAFHKYLLQLLRQSFFGTCMPTQGRTTLHDCMKICRAFATPGHLPGFLESNPWRACHTPSAPPSQPKSSKESKCSLVPHFSFPLFGHWDTYKCSFERHDTASWFPRFLSACFRKARLRVCQHQSHPESVWFSQKSVLLRNLLLALLDPP